MTKKKNGARMQSGDHIHQLEGRDYEELLPFRIMKDGTSLRFDPLKPAGTARRYPKSEPAGTTLHGRHGDRMEYGGRNAVPPSGRSTMNPGDPFMGRAAARTQPAREVVLDTSGFHVRVKMPDGRPGFASLTILIDKATRSVLATSVQEQGTNPDIGSLIDQARTPRVDRPARPLSNPGDIRRMNLPWPSLIDDENQGRVARRAAHRIFGLLTDDSTYRSRGLADASRRLGIILTKPNNLTPIDSAIAERAFSTIYDYFVQKLPGQRGPHA